MSPDLLESLPKAPDSPPKTVEREGEEGSGGVETAPVSVPATPTVESASSANFKYHMPAISALLQRIKHPFDMYSLGIRSEAQELTDITVSRG
jgi:hypothetical protein